MTDICTLELKENGDFQFRSLSSQRKGAVVFLVVLASSTVCMNVLTCTVKYFRINNQGRLRDFVPKMGMGMGMGVFAGCR